MDDQKQEDNLEKKEDNDGCGWVVVIVLIVFAVIGLMVLGIVRYWRWLGNKIGSGSYGMIVFFVVLGIIFDIVFFLHYDKKN